MDFAFNFELPDENSSQLSEKNIANNNGSGKNYDALISYEVNSFHSEAILSKLSMKNLQVSDHSLMVIDTNVVEQLILSDSDFKDAVDDSNILHKIISHSDLADGVYEGGLKIWEGALDLGQFISENMRLSSQMKDKSILELGCGAGIPGICCALYGAKRVDFQDYNAEVLQLLTQPNVANNVNGGTECHYYAGDWSSLRQVNSLKNLKYDVILSAETIYNVSNYAKLHSVFESLLSENGLILIAAKSYYFGVGGNIEAFQEFVENKKCFTVQVVHTVDKGVHRKILQLQRSDVKDTNEAVKKT